MALMHRHLIVLHIEGHVRHVKEVIGKVFLDDVALITAADNELVDPVGRIDLHYMPEDRFAADFHHRLGFKMGLLGNPSTEATCQNYRFHNAPSNTNTQNLLYCFCLKTFLSAI